MEIERALSSAGIDLPEPPAEKGLYEAVTVVDRSVYVSGQLPVEGGELAHEGRLGDEVPVDEGREAARLCALNALALMRREDPRMDPLITKVEGFVASTPGFWDHPEVVNGASEVFVELFGRKGKHARIAVGVSSLPLNAPVEIAVEARL